MIASATLIDRIPGATAEILKRPFFILGVTAECIGTLLVLTDCLKVVFLVSFGYPWQHYPVKFSARPTSRTPYSHMPKVLNRRGSSGRNESLRPSVIIALPSNVSRSPKTHCRTRRLSIAAITHHAVTANNSAI